MNKVTTIFGILLISLTSLASGSVEILKDESGKIRHMNQYEAMKSCPSGSRLATAREAAELIQKGGAKGILELNTVAPAGYYQYSQLLTKISGVNSDGQKDEFFNNNAGYKRPNNEFGKNWFWTASIDSNDPVYQVYAYSVSGHSGAILSFNRETRYNAVLCVQTKE